MVLGTKTKQSFNQLSEKQLIRLIVLLKLEQLKLSDDRFKNLIEEAKCY